MFWSATSDDPVNPISLSEECKQSIDWWVQEERLASGTPSAPAASSFSSPLGYISGSLTSWGAHLQDLTTREVWSREKRELLISVLEMKAVQLALKVFLPGL